LRAVHDEGEARDEEAMVEPVAAVVRMAHRVVKLG